MKVLENWKSLIMKGIANMYIGIKKNFLQSLLGFMVLTYLMQRHHSMNKFFENKISFHSIHESCNLVRHRHENGDVLSM